MSTQKKFGVIIGIIIVICGLFVFKNYGISKPNDAISPIRQTNIPRLVDLGSDTCIPCQKMAPILAELQTEYAGRVQVEVIDIKKKPEERDKYRIKIIPTQILYDANGKEVMRHEGFMSKERLIKSFELVGVK